MTPTIDLPSPMSSTLPLDHNTPHGSFSRSTALDPCADVDISLSLPTLADCSVVLAEDHRYPANLANTAAAAPTLYIRGSLTSRNNCAVAIVGSRKAGTKALEAARWLGSRLADRDCTIVSGLARGVDTAAHLGALAVDGQTVAVIGTGINRYFPPENSQLQERIAHAGAVVSQFDPDQEPNKTTFPARNAVIAGLARGSVIVDAAERSGTRIQINWTLKLGRPVLLWGPTIGHREWAQRLAVANDLVSMVNSVDEVMSAIA